MNETQELYEVVLRILKVLLVDFDTPMIFYFLLTAYNIALIF